MGREIRRVPAGWEHPRQNGGRCFKPLHDEDFESAARRWLDELDKWLAGGFAQTRAEHPEYGYDPETPLTCFDEWHGGYPDSEYYRPRWTLEEATHYQLYETVSEGTPLSPVFATTGELVEHLVVHGDGWDQPVSREAAEAFVRDGWVPSMVFSEGRVTTGVAIAGEYPPRDDKA